MHQSIPAVTPKQTLLKQVLNRMLIKEHLINSIVSTYTLSILLLLVIFSFIYWFIFWYRLVNKRIIADLKNSRQLLKDMFGHSLCHLHFNDNNNIAEHHLQTNQRINWDSTGCVIYSTNYYQWLTLESWFTNWDQMPLNRYQELPEMTEMTIWLTIDWPEQ